MPKRNITFTQGEYYHICNRGVDGRDIILDTFDADRMVMGMLLFNQIAPIGSIYKHSFHKGVLLSYPATKLHERLVDVVAYCFNPNHFHLLLRERSENGIPRFMHDFAGGYARYFNCRYNRTGSLYQGRFRARHIDTNEYLLWASVYVNCNDQVHQLDALATRLVRSSWGEYGVSAQSPLQSTLCESGVVLEQYPSRAAYKRFAKEALVLMQARKDQLHILDTLADE